jgi:hypothetical protein
MQLLAMNLESVIERESGIVQAEIGGQTVIMSVAQGSYFALDQSARRIWELMVAPMRIGDIVDHLIEEYEIDRVQCEAEVLAFLRQLQENGLAAKAR